MKATSRTRSSATADEADHLPVPSNRASMTSNRDSMYSSRDSINSSSGSVGRSSQRGTPPGSFSSYRSSSSFAPSRKTGASLSRTTSSPSTVCPIRHKLSFRVMTRALSGSCSLSPEFPVACLSQLLLNRHDKIFLLFRASMCMSFMPVSAKIGERFNTQILDALKPLCRSMKARPWLKFLP